MCVYIYICTYKCVYASIYIYICMYSFMCVCTYIYIYIYIYTDIHIYPPWSYPKYWETPIWKLYHTLLLYKHLYYHPRGVDSCPQGDETKQISASPIAWLYGPEARTTRVVGGVAYWLSVGNNTGMCYIGYIQQ